MCGGLRAVNDLTNGHVLAATSSNLLVTLLVPAALVLMAIWFAESWTGVRPLWLARHARLYNGALLVALVMFMVVRNTALGAWLAP